MISPPRLIQHVWSLILPPAMRDGLLGDVEQEFSRIAAEQSVACAQRWYVRELLRSVWPVLSWRLFTSLLLRAMIAASIGIAAIYLFEFLAYDLVFGESQSGTPAVYSDFSKVIAFGSIELFLSGVVAGAVASSLSLRGGAPLWVVAALTLAGFLIGYSIFYAFALPDLMSVQLRLALMTLKVPVILAGAWVGARLCGRWIAVLR